MHGYGRLLRLTGAVFSLLHAFSLAGQATAQEALVLRSCDTGLGAEPVSLPSCRDEGGAAGIRDPEFLNERFLATWQSGGLTPSDGTVFIAPVDPVTGMIRASAALTVSGAPVSQGLTNNGPEWGLSARGPEIFYTCFGSAPNTLQICKIAGQPGSLRVEALPASDGLSMRVPSRAASNSAPRLLWKSQGGSGGVGRGGWRVDTANPVDVPLDPSYGPAAWLPDGSGLVVAREVALGGLTVSGLALYDLQTQRSRPIIVDGRVWGGAIAWAAPELGGATAILGIVLDAGTSGATLEAYREAPNGEWVLWSALPGVCPSHFNTRSPEIFVVDGRSHVSAVSYSEISDGGGPGVVWIATVDPALPPEQQVRRLVGAESCDAPPRTRRDPETLVLQGDAGARVYFMEGE